MHIYIICIHHKLPTWVTEPIEHWQKQLDWSLQTITLKPSTKPTMLERMQQEMQSIQQAIKQLKHKPTLIALDEAGKLYNTNTFVKQWQSWQQNPALCFVIGGADGLHIDFKQQCQLLSLSPLTMTHPLAQLVLSEQIYRCWSILKSKPYHRAGCE